MPVLPYCIILTEAQAAPPASGVRGSSIETLIHGGLRCFYSRLDDFSLASAPDLKHEALRFDAIIRELLAQTAVIPFRFPTLLACANELKKFVLANATRYAAALKRLCDVVQMELRIEHAGLAPTAGDSGTAYLAVRAAAARAVSGQADQARASASELIREWRTRNVARGLRCYALVPRNQVAEFQTRMRSLSTREDVTIVVSGPWPAVEFLDDSAQS